MPSPVNSIAPLPCGVPPTLGPSGLPENQPAVSSSSSAQPPVQSPATARPRIASNRVSPASIAQLDAIKASGSKAQQFLAEALLSHIRNGTLELGNPAAQSDRARYGKIIVQPDNRRASMVANFTVGQDGQLELCNAALRDVLSRSIVAIITCPPPNNPLVAPASKPEGPMASGADSRGDVEFVREEIDLTRGGTVAPESSILGKRPERSSGSPPSGPVDKRLDQRPTPERQTAAPEIAGAAGGQPAQEAATSISRKDFKRNMQVAAALHARGWTQKEVAEFKCTPAHIALLRDTHHGDTALLEKLNAHIETRQSLGKIVGNFLFVIQANGSSRYLNIPKDSLSFPQTKSVDTWSQAFKSDPFVESADKPDIDINAARERLRELPKHEAWEKACAPVAKKLLEENLTDDQLGALTWQALRDKFQGDDKRTLKALRQKATNMHQPMKPTDLVFPTVPEGMTRTAYLLALCAAHLPVAPAEAGQAEAAGAPQ